MKDILISLCGRGGSKGIKNKNIRPLCGVPLIAWTLFDALRAFERREDVRKTIVVDSDSEAILETARWYSPNVLLHTRREDLAGDTVAKMDVLREVLADTSKETGRKFDAMIDLDITSPLRTFEDVEGAFALFERDICEVTFSVVPARRNPYFNMVEIDAAGRGALCKPSDFVARQQAPLVFDMNASIYVYRPEVFARSVKSPVGLEFGIFCMRDYGVIDIDSEEDLELMEVLLTHGEHLLSEPLRAKKRLLRATIEEGAVGHE
jgi:CMP-N-acetylneuraminic acid synthetase